MMVFSIPEVEIVRFDANDILTTSGNKGCEDHYCFECTSGWDHPHN